MRNVVAQVRVQREIVAHGGDVSLAFNPAAKLSEFRHVQPRALDQFPVKNIFAFLTRSKPTLEELTNQFQRAKATRVIESLRHY
jgi:hypothetical protein